MAAGVTWDLSPLYTGPGDPRLEADAARAAVAAREFAACYRGRVADLDPAALADAIAHYEAIRERGRRPAFYASLLQAADTDDPEARRLAERTQEAWVGVADDLTAFEIELKQLDDSRFAVLIADPALADARHWLGALRARRAHALSEAEERIVNRKNLAGREAFVRLFDELSSSLRFPVEVDGASRDLGAEEVLALLHAPDAALRERAYRGLLEGFAAHGVTLTGVLNAVLYDHRLDCELRRFPDVVLPTHLDNEVDGGTVETMMAATERHYALAREWFRLKAEILGLPRLKVCDVYAPLPGTRPALTFDAARDLVLDAFGSFSPGLADLARDFFTRRWIDAEVRPGKRLGAFCASHGPADNPWILMTFTGAPGDGATLAHELGHGLHDRLAARQRPLDYAPPLPLAETASTFAEMLYLRALLAREPSPAVRRAILAATLDDVVATLFRQNVLTRFEMAAHERRRAGTLDAETLGDLWWAENARLFGDAVEMIPAYRWGWSYIPHFVHSRFYCYAYVFGELLVLALWRRWLDEGEAFVPRYLELLAAGGSQAPAVLLGRIGVDVRDPAFWESGFTVLASLLDDLRATG